MRFALVGAAGYVAPRHMRAIQETGNQLVAACDPHDSVGVLDKYAPDCKFFTEIERFDRHLCKNPVDWLSVCTPNYLHDAHCRLGLRLGLKVICEKPLVINPWNLDQLQALGEVYTILQLRLHPRIQALRKAVTRGHRVSIEYHTKRGPWYQTSWKGSEDKSGGVLMNIGVHMFDMLIWVFGPVVAYQGNRIWTEKAIIDWNITTEKTERSVMVDGQIIDFTEGLEDLHTKSYQEILEGRGFGIEEARPSIDLIRKLRK